ncbi:MAG: hypothetical protein CSA96_08145 [Bacteroidetes bacterium]|nr:MAG: hypothetical protein CSA96_08145 [Bacteroidota bacterium]
MSYKAYIPLLVLLSALSSGLQAQGASTLYLMHGVQQSSLLNPAIGLNCRYFVGLPGMTSNAVVYNNTAFTANELLQAENWPLETILGQLHRSDLFGVSAQASLLSLGYKLKGWTLRFDLLEELDAALSLPRDLPRLAIKGNGSFVGETVRLNGFRIVGLHRRAWTLAASRALNSRLRAGLRARLLFGKSAIHTGISRSSLSTSEEHFYIDLNLDYRLDASFPLSVERPDGQNFPEIRLKEIDPAAYLLNRENPGFALDLGLIYRLSEQSFLSASLLNLGFIHWKSDLNSLEFIESFSFQRVETGTELVSRDNLLHLADSLFQLQQQLITHEAFNTMLPPRLYLGASHQLNETFSLGAVSTNTIYRTKLHTALTLSGSATVLKALTASLSWSWMNHSPLHIGAALSWQGKGLQLFIASDHLAGFFYPFDSRSLQIQWGFGLLFGCPRNKRSMIRKDDPDRLPLGGDCRWSGKESRRKRRKRGLKN